jgi:hypothetical protein
LGGGYLGGGGVRQMGSVYKVRGVPDLDGADWL